MRVFTSKTRGSSAIASASALMAAIPSLERSSTCWSPRRVSGEITIKSRVGFAGNGIRDLSVVSAIRVAFGLWGYPAARARQ